MKDEKEYDDLIKRIRFKPLPYDVASNYNRLRSRLATDDVRYSKVVSSVGWKWFAAAASIALLIVSSLYFVSLRPAGAVWYETTAVPDAKTKIVLSDSSTVWLNANAFLRYPRSFDDRIRKVNVAGEAFFKVRKGKMPFVVDLGRLQIKVLGTSFNVIMNEDSDEIIITLLEGRIALYDSSRPETPEKILRPNEQAVYSGSDGRLTVTPIRPESITSWVTGIFRFDNHTLAEIAWELERAFHVKIHVEDEMMRQKTFNAVFDDKETLDEILSILQISAKYTIERKRGEIYLK
jgi:ferric-dicitrate binding protein FerR (iron transport regulator)